MSTENKQKKPNIFDDRTVGEYFTGENLFFGALFSGVIGVFGALGGMAIDENLPLSDDERPGQMQALEQYNVMLTDLTAQYNTLRELQNDGSGMPATLKNYQAANTDNPLSEQEISTKRDAFNALAQSFAVSTTIDARLSEDDTRDLAEAFEKRVGNYKSLTGLAKPDFGDLDHYRPASLAGVSDETRLAQAVVTNTRKNVGSVTMGYTGLGGLMLWPLLLLGFIGKEFVTAEKGLNLRRHSKLRH
ncbi:MAG: hypothetical protein HND56_08700 [Pseudomonadota bacterium]|nr:hypothetical protein [Pseudomonadota bacterium]QKK05759.1 MAG: hypothetical protein HND56_08700 [Pseudomonadota bacterium]